MIQTLSVQTLDVISVNLWSILISLANLLIIFLILKKLLWKPVKKVMDQRKAMVDKQFADAAEAQAKAEADKAEWAAKLAEADAEAKSRIADADETARRHSDRLVEDARERPPALFVRRNPRRSWSAERWPPPSRKRSHRYPPSWPRSCWSAR